MKIWIWYWVVSFLSFQKYGNILHDFSTEKPKNAAVIIAVCVFLSGRSFGSGPVKTNPGHETLSGPLWLIQEQRLRKWGHGTWTEVPGRTSALGEWGAWDFSFAGAVGGVPKNLKERKRVSTVNVYYNLP